MRLHLFDNFRAIAILLVVAGHSFDHSINSRNLGEMFFRNTILGGTTLFVFISGLFFYHIYYYKFQYKYFMLKKIKYVFLPYLMLSAIGFVFSVFYVHNLPLSLFSFALFLKYLLTGDLFIGYWYIPFIMTMYLISPFFIWQIKWPLKIKIGVFGGLLCVSMLLHRPLYNINILHSVLYFLPVYMLGIICAIHKDKALDFVKNKTIYLVFCGVLVSLGQILFYGRYGNFHKDYIFDYAGIDVMLLQKIIMCFFLLSILQKLDNTKILVFEYIASRSFAIYFLHPIILKLLEFTDLLRKIHNQHYLHYLSEFVVTFCVLIILSIVLSEIVKFILGKNSRFLIGW